MSQVQWVALATANRIGGKTITHLLAHFGSLEAVFDASRKELERVPGVGRITAQAIADIDLPAIEAACLRFVERGIQIATWEDPHYPSNLLLCDDAPPALFVRGALRSADTHAVAIVGTRTPRLEGAELAQQLGFELARRGWIVVSGLALGIDAAAHQGALDAGGRTLAVLGCGVLRMYPPANLYLAESILKHGAILSEYHPEIGVSAQNLIARNRVTSGLSRAVIVVQSGEDSGSMSTARRAWQQGRAVFAVTGGDQGCETLLANGAEPLNPASLDWDYLSTRLDHVQAPLPSEHVSDSG